MERSTISHFWIPAWGGGEGLFFCLFQYLPVRILERAKILRKASDVYYNTMYFVLEKLEVLERNSISEFWLAPSFLCPLMISLSLRFSLDQALSSLHYINAM